MKKADKADKSNKSNKSVYHQMLDAGVEISHHYSALYVPVNDITTKILENNNFKANVFKNNLDNKMWYDIPFGYIPFWDKILNKNIK
jgi:hypothetical protein